MEIISIEEFIRYFRKVRFRTRKLVESLNEEELQFRPKMTAFSIADHLRHIARFRLFDFGPVY